MRIEIAMILAMLVFSSVLLAETKPSLDNGRAEGAKDTASIASVIREQLNDKANGLYYPETVKRFYDRTDYKLLWVLPDTSKNHTWEAMLMLDCVLQFGLNHADFHPQKLLFEKLHKLIDNYDRVGKTEKVKFDILLTDAIITFMNQLHFGKLNSDYPAEKIDPGNAGFRADTVLFDALKSNDFMSAVTSVQPQSKKYRDLQEQMRLMTGQYVGDCYEVPEEQIRKVAINMERLRWVSTNDNRFMVINIPAFMLSVHLKDTIYSFKVVVGRPVHPTPQFQSVISYFMTSTEKKVGTDPVSVAFCFPNKFDITLYGTKEKQLFNRQDRAISNGYLLVEQPEKLAALLLQDERDSSKTALMYKAIREGQAKNFNLEKVMPVKVIYLTCEIRNGMITNYSDLYDLDKQLEKALYAPLPEKLSRKE